MSGVGHEGLWLLIIWLLGERTWGRGAAKAGRGEEGRQHQPLTAGSLKQGLQLPEDFATLPPGGRRGGLCPTLFRPDSSSQGKGAEAHCQRRPKWTGQGEPSESSHSLSLPLPPFHTCLFAPLVFQAVRFFPSCGPHLGPDHPWLLPGPCPSRLPTSSPSSFPPEGNFQPFNLPLPRPA